VTLVPVAVVTVTSTVPLPAGEVAVIWVALLTVQDDGDKGANNADHENVLVACAMCLAADREERHHRAIVGKAVERAYALLANAPSIIATAFASP
jgi:hypothetical protein